MPRVLGLGLLLAASTAAAEPPVASDFALRHAFAPPRPGPAVSFKFESPMVDYSSPTRPERRRGFLAAVQVAPNGFLGIGLSDRKLMRSALTPDAERNGRRGGKKLAVRFRLDF